MDLPLLCSHGDKMMADFVVEMFDFTLVMLEATSEEVASHVLYPSE
jgi:hypothetical protein